MPRYAHVAVIAGCSRQSSARLTWYICVFEYAQGLVLWSTPYTMLERAVITSARSRPSPGCLFGCVGSEQIDV